MPIQPVEKIWMDGEFVDWHDAKIHVLTHTLHYGNGVFEGIRAYNTDRGAAVFRLTPHIERLFRSAKILGIEIPYTPEQLIEATKQTVAINELEACYIRPLVYLGYGEMGLNPLPCPVNVSIAVWRWGIYLGADSVNTGVRMMISSWQRHDANAMPPAAKGCGHYINSQMAKVQAINAGYDEAIPAVAAGPRERVHRREPVRGGRRADHHSADQRRRPRGHHPGRRAHHRR